MVTKVYFLLCVFYFIYVCVYMYVCVYIYMVFFFFGSQALVNMTFGESGWH